MKKQLYTYIKIFVEFCCLLLSVIVLVFSLSGKIIDLPVAVCFLAVFISIILVFIRRKKIYMISIDKKSQIGIWIILLATGIGLRILPVLMNMTYMCENNLSDTGVHFFAAQQIANGFLEQKIREYELMFPYLFPYSLVLALFNIIFGKNIQYAIVFSNLFFDICGGMCLYFLLKKSNGCLKKGIFLWIFNPLSIVMCWLPLNIVLVNTTLCLLLLEGMILLNSLQLKSQKKYIFAGLTGITIFVANLFRPIFTVILIALIICIIGYQLKENRKEIGAYIVGLILITATLVPQGFLENQIEYKYKDDILGSSGGWSFYVGSNYETSGQWSPEDRDYFFGPVLSDTTSISEAQNYIKEQGIKRYKEMGLVKGINHFSNKLGVLFSDISNCSYDLKYTLNIKEDGGVWKIISSGISAFFVIGALTSVCFWYKNSQERKLSELFIGLCFLGFTAAFLIVEVMNRYSAIYFVIFIILMSLYKTERKMRKVKLK